MTEPDNECPDRPGRDDVPQYALPLVIRVEKATPPRRTDALEAAARAVLFFLTDPRVTEPDGEWAAAVRAWTDGRIRKVVRRARGAGWQRAQALPGITLTHGTAEIRVFPPVPVDAWPPDLARLQVSGTELEDPDPDQDQPRTPDIIASSSGVPRGVRGPGGMGGRGPAMRGKAVPPGGTAARPVLYLNPQLPMTAGKAMAQVGHGAQLAWLAADATGRSEWKDSEFDLVVRTASPRQWTELTSSGLPVVRDGGFTEIAPGSCTVVADLPVLRRALATRGAG